MGEVYKAEDMKLKRVVALKVLPLASTADPEAKQRLVHEAQAASALDHPNICTIHEIDETPDGRLFLAMAYYEGETLKQRIARGPLGLEETSYHMTQVARGASAAHDAGIIHRDIKPANIVLTRRGEVKLLDFGLARLSGQTVHADRHDGRHRRVHGTRTDHGSGCRRAIGRVGTRCDDVQMLAGRLPFTGAHDIAVLRAIADHEPPALCRCQPERPYALESIVAQGAAEETYGRVRIGARVSAGHGSTPHAGFGLGRCTAVGGRRSASTVTRLMIGAGVCPDRQRPAGGSCISRHAQASVRRSLEQMTELVEKEDFPRAYLLIRQVEPRLAGDPDFARVRDSFLWPASIRDRSARRRVYREALCQRRRRTGSTSGNRRSTSYGCFCNFRWRITKPGFSTLEGAGGMGDRAVLHARSLRARLPRAWSVSPRRPCRFRRATAIRLLTSTSTGTR